MIFYNYPANNQRTRHSGACWLAWRLPLQGSANSLELPCTSVTGQRNVTYAKKERVMNIKEVSIDQLKPYANNPRNNKNAIKYVADSISKFGFKIPMVVTPSMEIVCGHTRYEAAKRLGMSTVPCVIADDLTEAQIKAFRIIDNKSNELASWDFAKMNKEIEELFDYRDEFEQFDLHFNEMAIQANELLSSLSPMEIKSDKSADKSKDSDLLESAEPMDECRQVTCPKCGHCFEVDECEI